MIDSECWANGLFKTSIYLLEVVKVEEVMHFSLFLKIVDVLFYP